VRTWMGVRRPLIVLITIGRPQAHPRELQCISARSPSKIDKGAGGH
jgi:hypothetical protein